MAEQPPPPDEPPTNPGGVVVDEQETVLPCPACRGNWRVQLGDVTTGAARWFACRWCFRGAVTKARDQAWRRDTYRRPTE